MENKYDTYLQRFARRRKKLDNYKCENCGMRYSQSRTQCFYCGKFDTVHFNQIKKLPKQKSSVTGATLNIKVRSK